jgi:hypothetical protein
MSRDDTWTVAVTLILAGVMYFVGGTRDCNRGALHRYDSLHGPLSLAYQ